MIPTYMELSTDRTYCTYYNMYGGPTIHHRSSREIRWTPRERLLARLLADFSRETPRERWGGRRTQQPTRRRRWRRVTMMATTTTMATGDDNNDGDGQPFAPHERFLGLLTRDSSRETPRETPCKRLLARDSSRESSWGGRRTQQPTMNGRRDGIR